MQESEIAGIVTKFRLVMQLYKSRVLVYALDAILTYLLEMFKVQNLFKGEYTLWALKQ